MFHPLLRRRGLYAITNGPRTDLLEASRAALLGGARMLQYRDKTSDGTRRLEEARARLGAQIIIGVSCYDSLQRARGAAAAGADYLAFGAFFPSPTKPQARRATVRLLREARAFGLPLVAIGGITSDNAGWLITAGADYLAAISAVFGARDIRAAARRYTELFDTDQSG